MRPSPLTVRAFGVTVPPYGYRSLRPGSIPLTHPPRVSFEVLITRRPVPTSERSQPAPPIVRAFGVTVHINWYQSLSPGSNPPDAPFPLAPGGMMWHPPRVPSSRVSFAAGHPAVNVPAKDICGPLH
eukprot:Gb_29113 [translate_table: standard]